MEILNNSDIVYTVFEAVEDEKYMEVGEKILLETYDQDCYTAHQWRGMLAKNFGTGEPGVIYLDGPCDETVIKRHCYPKEAYINRFAQRTGANSYVVVDGNDLELEFTYDANWFNRKNLSNWPTRVEFYVVAKFKKTRSQPDERVHTNLDCRRSNCGSNHLHRRSPIRVRRPRETQLTEWKSPPQKEKKL